MKKVSFMVLIIGIMVLVSGCNNDIKSEVLKCKNTLDSEFNHVVKEKIVYNMDITLKQAKKEVTATLEEGELTDEEKEEALTSLKENYCNSEINSNYNCDAHLGEKNTIVIEEEGELNSLLGIKETLSYKEYKNIFKDKGFTCS